MGAALGLLGGMISKRNFHMHVVCGASKAHNQQGFGRHTFSGVTAEGPVPVTATFRHWFVDSTYRGRYINLSLSDALVFGSCLYLATESCDRGVLVSRGKQNKQGTRQGRVKQAHTLGSVRSS